MKCFKSGKQRSSEIKAARRGRRQARSAANALPARPPGRWVAVDYERLVPNNSYGQTDFAARGYYLDRPFCCVDCGAACVWSAERQRWWYEVAGGSQYATATRCAACREKERLRKAQSRQAAGHVASPVK